MNYKYKHLVNALIVAGWDEEEGGQARRTVGCMRSRRRRLPSLRG